MSKPERRSLKSPRHWVSWAGMALGWVLAQLPYGLQMMLGRRLGDLAYGVVPERRRIAAINLALCFPEKTPLERKRLLRAHFRSVGMGAVETAICWWSPAGKVRGLASIEGRHHLEDAVARGGGIILLSAHFTSLELGVRMGQLYLRELGVKTTAMYKPPHDPVVDYVMRTRRETHIGGKSIADNNLKGLLRALKKGNAVWYAGDQRARRRLGKMVDFFGQPAITHVAISRLARMTGATVVPFFTLRRADGRGYRLIVQAPLSDFPGSDELADAKRINALIEDVVRQAPEQYFWLHQRFRIKGRNPYEPASADA